jgi:hypothetical protein
MDGGRCAISCRSGDCPDDPTGFPAAHPAPLKIKLDPFRGQSLSKLRRPDATGVVALPRTIEGVVTETQP